MNSHITHASTTQLHTSRSHTTDDVHPLLEALATATGPLERELLEEAVIEASQKLLAGTVRRYLHRGIDRDDLAAVANLALLKAIRGFEASRGDFFAYASATIHGDLKKHFRDIGWTVRPPRAVQELQATVRRATEDLQNLGVEITDASLADATGAEVVQIREARTAQGCFTPTSLDSSLFGERTYGDQLAEDQREFALIEDWSCVASAWKQLSDDDRELLRLRFVEELSQQAIAPQLGISQMQVSRRLAKVLDRLRAAVEAPTTAAA